MSALSVMSSNHIKLGRKHENSISRIYVRKSNEWWGGQMHVKEERLHLPYVLKKVIF